MVKVMVNYKLLHRVATDHPTPIALVLPPTPQVYLPILLKEITWFL